MGSNSPCPPPSIPLSPSFVVVEKECSKRRDTVTLSLAVRAGELTAAAVRDAAHCLESTAPLAARGEVANDEEVDRDLGECGSTTVAAMVEVAVLALRVAVLAPLHKVAICASEGPMDIAAVCVDMAGRCSPKWGGAGA
jgi:hypothetical protein